MTWIEVVWPMMSAASLTLAWIHFVIWLQRRQQRVHLLFAFAAAAVAGIALLELAELRATTPEDFAASIRYAHPLLAIFMVSVIGIVRLQFNAGRRWLGWTVAGMRVAALIPNFFTGVNLNFQTVLALKHIEIWGSGPLSIGVVEPNPWMLLGQLSNLLMVAFLIDATIQVWRRDDPRQRRAALLVGGSFALAMLLAGSITAAVSIGFIELPLTFNPMFLPVLLAMSYLLGTDVVRAAQLGEQLQRNEIELRESEARFRLVVESAPAGMLMVAADGRVAMVNAKVERMFGYSRAELLTRSVGQLIPGCAIEAYFESAADVAAPSVIDADGTSMQLVGTRSDGSEIPIEVGFNPIRSAAGAFVLLSVNDISERLQREREVAHHHAQVMHLSRVATIGELTGSLAHELSQPLAAILSNAQAALGLVQDHRESSEDMRECLDGILASNKRGIEVIRRLRRMLKNQTIDLQHLNLNELVHDTLQLARNDLLNRGVLVATDLAIDLPEVSGDRVQLQQVILNLLLNAGDAMAGFTPEPRLTVHTRLSGEGCVELVVSDIGPGIPADQLEAIFEPFMTTKRDGLGLGLAVTRTIVQMHSGTIVASNDSGGGARFVVSLQSAGNPARANRT